MLGSSLGNIMIQELKVYASTINVDLETNVPQRRDITIEEFNDGLLKLHSFSAQQYNALMFLLTSHAAPHWSCPQLLSTLVTIPDSALEMDGQSFLEVDAPELYTIFAGTLPDIVADAPAGFTYIVRKQ